MRTLALGVMLVSLTARAEPRRGWGNGHWVGDAGTGAARIVSGRQPRLARVLDPASIDGWRATRDRDTGVVAQLWGGSYSVPGSTADAAIAGRAARNFLAQHPELAPGSGIGDFVLVANRLDGRLRTVSFQQTQGAMPVVGAHVFVVFGGDRLILASSTAVPAAVVSPIAGGVVVPLIYGRGDLDYRVARAVDDGAWTRYVDEAGTEILRDRRWADATSTLRFDVGLRRPGGPRQLAVAPRANLTVGGSNVQTGTDGTFTTGNPVITHATGALVAVSNAAGADATATLTAQAGQPLDWSLASDEQGDAQLTAFIYGNVAKAKARLIEPGLAWLDQQLLISVSEAGSCNAFSTGDDLHFFRADAVCENTARLADVVLHEFGHSFHKQSLIQGAGAFDLTLSEGLSDFFAANVDDDPGLGRGLHFDDTELRNLDPVGSEARFPDDVSGDPHITGLIIGGALWDLRTALGSTATEPIYLGIIRRAPDITGTYLAALVADDDDNDLANGTPHHCEIERAFVAHGLVPGFSPAGVAAPVVDGRTISVTAIAATATACPHAAVTAIDLAWSAGGADEVIAMTATGDTFTADIPPQPSGTVVTYQITAHLDDGRVLLLPDNPADPRYQLFVGEATPIFCDRLDVDPTTERPGWAITGTPTWQYARPFGRGGDPAVSFTGEAFLGTGISNIEGTYPPAAMATITTPPIDASQFSAVHLQFWRWLTVEDRAADLATVDVDGEPVWANASGVDHVDREWRFVDLTLTPGSHTIGWTITSDDTTQLGGWNIDDICVVAVVDPGACADCPSPAEAGCCSTGADSRGSILLGALGLVLLRLRRRQQLL